MRPRAQESDAQAIGQIPHQGGWVDAEFLKIVPIAVVISFEAYLITEAVALSKANQLEGRCHLELYGLMQAPSAFILCSHGVEKDGNNPKLYFQVLV